MVGASKLRKAARIIALPCASFSRSQPKVDSDVDTNISTSGAPAYIQNASKNREGAETSTGTKNLCAICLEPLSYSTSGSPSQAIFTAQCSHAFHFACISSNVRHGSVTCPICRAHWTQLPRNLNPPCSLPCNQSDPVLRILDDSIATFRVHRRSSLRSVRYNDDDPVEPHHNNTPSHPRLHLSLIPATAPLTHPLFYPCGCGQPTLTSYHPCGCGLPALHHFTGSSSFPAEDDSSNLQKPRHCSNGSRAYLSVKLAHQQATDLVLVASPNGSHLRLLKQAMALVVFSLRSVDRLAIVTYSSAATRAFPLRRMTSHGKRTALQVVDRLFYMGQADPVEGLKKGIKILEDRSHKNPQSCILHLSDSPSRSYLDHDMEVPIPIHRFHVGFGFGSSNGFVMHEFEEFLARLLGGVIRETQLRIGEDGRVVRLGELRGGEERRVALILGECGYICVGYSYVEDGVEECVRIGETIVGVEDKRESSHDREPIGGRTSSVESWDYHDPQMARRWAKHLHGYRL